MNYTKNCKILSILFALTIVGKTFAQVLSDTCIIPRGTDPDIQVSEDSIINISWASVGENPNQRYTYYQQFNIHANPITEPIKVSENMGVQYTFLKLGKEHLIIIWRQVMMTFQSFILGQIQDNNGQLIKRNFYVNEDISSDYERVPIDIIPFKDSIFCVLWNGDGDLSSEDAIYGQFVTHSVRGIGGNFMVSDFPDQDFSPLGGYGDFNENTDSFISVWTDERDSTSRIYGRIFSSDGIFTGSSILFGDTTITSDVYFPHAFWDTDTSLIFFFKLADEFNIYVQRFTISGESLTLAMRINEIDRDVMDYSVSKDDDGRLIVIWTDYDSKYIYAQRIDNNLLFIGNNFKVSNNSYYYIYRLKSDIKDGNIYTIFNNWPYEIYLNIFNYDDPPVGIDKKQERFPKDFILYQNYPNPFNSSTSINFEIDKTSEIKIVIYDILGNQVKLITNQQYRPGYYTIQWNGNNDERISMPSGIYFVKAFLPYKIYAKKMILIK